MTHDSGRILIIPRGKYNPSRNYEMLDYVSYNDTGWFCKKACTGIVPEENDYWTCAIDATFMTDIYNEVVADADAVNRKATEFITKADQVIADAQTVATNTATVTSKASEVSTNADNARLDALKAVSEADRAKAEADRAQAIAGVGIATTSLAGIVKPDGKTIDIKPDGTIEALGDAKVASFKQAGWDVLPLAERAQYDGKPVIIEDDYESSICATVQACKESTNPNDVAGAKAIVELNKTVEKNNDDINELNSNLNGLFKVVMVQHDNVVIPANGNTDIVKSTTPNGYTFVGWIGYNLWGTITTACKVTAMDNYAFRVTNQTSAQVENTIVTYELYVKTKAMA